ncbi:PGF-CTERM sorting domain-containing protein [Methanococcoides sp. AM1]|uniref:COG1470 family protein n=1 Tax=Methanococcoides sp. AM1 TaxID=1201011 RepID=UPI001083C451|nr:PGF-CTERM sorting domain-containing protein [Methanococcoides sp. AM1]
MSSPALADEGITVGRDISEDTVSAGDSFIVTVSLSSTDSYKAPMIDEDLPEGWTVSMVQDNGALFKESTHEWMWSGHILPGESRDLVYEVTVPSSEKAGTYIIHGKASFYTSSDEYISVPIIGDDTITITGSSSSGNTGNTDDSSSTVSSLTDTSTSSAEIIPEESVEVNKEESNVDPVTGGEPVGELENTEVSRDDVQSQDSEPNTPGFELIMAVSGLLMSLFCVKGTKRQK